MGKDKHIKTKYGTASITKDGYYRITSSKEGNLGKLVHRLIFEDFYNIQLPNHIVIHHLNENKLDNHIWNLIPLTINEHVKLHGKNISDRTRLKRSNSMMGDKNPMYGLTFSDAHINKISNSMKKLWSEERYRYENDLPLKTKLFSKEKYEKLSKINTGINNPQSGKGIVGFLRVTIDNCNTCNQGFVWRYRYIINNKRKSLISVDLFKLRCKVLENNLEWLIVDESKAFKSISLNNLLNDLNYSLEEFR